MAEKRKSRKEKRQDLILEFIKKKKGKCNRKEILDELEKYELDVNLTTIYRDIDEMGYEIGPDGTYIVKIPVAAKRNLEALANIFANDTPSFAGPYLIPRSAKEQVDSDIPKKNKDIRIFIIQVTAGFETTISELIYSIYRDKVRGVIPGCGCILILAKDIKSYKTIRKELRELSQKSSHKSNTPVEDNSTDIE